MRRIIFCNHLAKADEYATRDDRPGIPQLFTSMPPALNEAALYLAETTSIFTRCFTSASGMRIILA